MRHFHKYEYVFSWFLNGVNVGVHIYCIIFCMSIAIFPNCANTPKNKNCLFIHTYTFLFSLYCTLLCLPHRKWITDDLFYLFVLVLLWKLQCSWYWNVKMFRNHILWHIVIIVVVRVFVCILTNCIDNQIWILPKKFFFPIQNLSLSLLRAHSLHDQKKIHWK